MREGTGEAYDVFEVDTPTDGTGEACDGVGRGVSLRASAGGCELLDRVT